MSEESLAANTGAVEGIPVDEELLALQSEVLRALAHPARLQILYLLRDGERCVCEIEPVLGLRQPNISQHLATLRGANLVASRRDGLRMMYRVVDTAVFEVLDLATEIIRRQGRAIVEAVERGALCEGASKVASRGLLRKKRSQ